MSVRSSVGHWPYAAPTRTEAARDAANDAPVPRLPLTGPCADPWCSPDLGRHLHPFPRCTVRLCWKCDAGFDGDELVDVDGIAMCSPCAAVEVGQDDEPDRAADR